MSVLWTILAGLVTFLGGVYLYFQYQYTYWMRKNVPFIKPVFPFGSFKELNRTASLGQVLRKAYESHSDKKIIGIWSFSTPSLIIKDLELMKKIMIKEFSSFHDRGFIQAEKYDPLTGNLFFLNGLKWRNLRIKLIPTFTSGKMKMMFPTLIKCGEELKEALDKPASLEETIEVKQYLASFTTEVIASCAFGLEINAFKNPDSEFRKMSSFLFRPSFKQAMRNMFVFLAPRFSEFFKIMVVPENVTEFFLNAVKETIEYREANNVQRNDFMQLLIELKNKGRIEDSEVYRNEDKPGEDYDPTFTIKDAAAQAFVFFNAGFETSSTAMSFALFELALNQDIQNQLRDEIDRVIAKHNGQITYEGIQEMEYLDKVVSETLRKHPPAPAVVRECTQSYYLAEENIIIEKGTRIFIPIWGVHHDPNYYPDPEKFDPERFSAEEKQKRSPQAYLPFGDGPRACIGAKFALMQTKTGLVIFLSNFKVSISDKTTIPIKYNPKVILTELLGGMHLKISHR